MEVITLNLCDRPRAEVHQNSYWEFRSPQIAEGLELFALPYLGDALALDDDIAARHTYHEIHLDERLQWLTLEERMVLILLLHLKTLMAQTLAECLLVDVLRQPGAQILLHIVHAADNGINIVDKRLAYLGIYRCLVVGDFHISILYSAVMDRILTKENSCVPEYLFRRKTSTRWAMFILKKTTGFRELCSLLRAMDYRLQESELSTVAFSIALHVLSREPAPQFRKWLSAQNHVVSLRAKCMQ